MMISGKEELSYSDYAYLNLVKNFRHLMTQMAFLTREYFKAVFSDYGNADTIASRLYDLPHSFQQKAELIFGTPLSEEFLHLLSLHAIYIQTLANALAKGDQAEVDYSIQRLYANAADIAAHYAKINPFWEEKQWQTLLYNYVGMLIQDAMALASGDFDKDLDIFDRMLRSALLMGDYQADGFIQYMTAK